MELTLQRDSRTPKSTQGLLDIDGLFVAYTLERPEARYESDYHCIPTGRYRIEIYASPHFQRLMPLLMNVPGHSGIEIHWGNWPLDSKGCILVGCSRSLDELFETRKKFEELFPVIEAGTKTVGGCWINVLDAQALPGVEESTA